MISFIAIPPLQSLRIFSRVSSLHTNLLQFFRRHTGRYNTSPAVMQKADAQDRDDRVHSPSQNDGQPLPSRRVSDQLAAKRREKPPMRYTEDFQTPETVTMRTIGVVRSPYKERFGTPRQPIVTQNTLGNEMQPATIELFKNCRYELALRGLAQFEYCWVVSFFHLNQGFNPLVTPPRGPRQKQGVFATRSPHRPNSIGLSCIRITSVDEKEGLVHLLGVDLLDGTPVLDIKPYVPYCDSFPNAKSGWLDKLSEDMKAPDALGYHPPPAHLMQGSSTKASEAQEEYEKREVESNANTSGLDTNKE